MSSTIQNYKLAWRLAIKDIQAQLRHSLFGGFRLFILALALGVAAMTIVGSIRATIETAIENDARFILGGDAELRLRMRLPNEAEYDYLKANSDGYSQVIELSTMAFSGSLSDEDRANAKRSLIEIKAVDDAYPLYGEVVIAQGAPFDDIHNKPHQLYASDQIRSKLGIEIGDILRIGAVEFSLAGIIDTIPDRGLGFFDMGPEVLISFSSLQETGLMQAGSLMRHYSRLKLPEDVDFALWQADLNTQFPDANWRVRGLDEAVPALERILERVGSFLTLISLSTLIIGGVGAANAVRAFMVSKSETIATLKSLGGSSRLIFTIYLIEALFMALIGIAIGLFIGMISQWMIAGLLAEALPVSTAGQIHLVPILVATSLGLLVTLLFSLLTLGQAANIPAAGLFRGGGTLNFGRPSNRVLLALGVIITLLIVISWLITPDKRLAFWFLVALSGLLMLFSLIGLGATKIARRLKPSRSVPLRLALMGLSKPGAPAVGVAISLGLGLTILVAVTDLENNISKQLEANMERDVPSLVALDIQPSQAGPLHDLVKRIDGAQIGVITPMIRATVSHIKGVPAADIDAPEDHDWVLEHDRRLTWSAKPILSGEGRLTAGEWWAEDYKGGALISLDDEVAKAFDLKIGDDISFNILGMELTTKIANLRYVDYGSMDVNFAMILAPGSLIGNAGDTITSLPHINIATIKNDAHLDLIIEREITNEFSNISILQVRSVIETLMTIIGQLSLAIRALAMIVLVAGLIVLAGAILAQQSERVKESIVLKAVGATRQQQLASWLIEYSLLALITAIIASMAGVGASFYIVSFIMEQTHTASFFGVGLVVMLTLLLVIPFGMLAGYRILGEPPLRYLRNA